MQLFNAAKLLLADLLLFSRKVMQNMVNIQTYKHISQKRISGLAVSVPKAVKMFQGNRSFLSDMIGCGYLTAIY